MSDRDDLHKLGELSAIYGSDEHLTAWARVKGERDRLRAEVDRLREELAAAREGTRPAAMILDRHTQIVHAFPTDEAAGDWLDSRPVDNGRYLWAVDMTWHAKAAPDPCRLSCARAEQQQEGGHGRQA